MTDGATTTEDEVGRDAVYREAYTEMRRYRDYEFSSSTWYTALLLAILGYLVAVRFGDTAKDFRHLLSTTTWPKVVISVSALTIAAASTYLIYYSARRYTRLRDWVYQHLEPGWKAKTFKPERITIAPRHIHYAMPWLLVLVILIVTWVGVSTRDGAAAASGRTGGDPTRTGG